MVSQKLKLQERSNDCSVGTGRKTSYLTEKLTYKFYFVILVCLILENTEGSFSGITTQPKMKYATIECMLNKSCCLYPRYQPSTSLARRSTI